MFKTRQERQDFFKLLRFAFFVGLILGLAIITTPGI